MSTSTSTNSAYLKPLITGAVAVAGDKFLLNEQDMNKSLYFGAACAAGTFLGAMVGDSLPVVIPAGGTYYDAKTLEQRLHRSLHRFTNTALPTLQREASPNFTTLY